MDTFINGIIGAMATTIVGLAVAFIKHLYSESKRKNVRISEEEWNKMKQTIEVLLVSAKANTHDQFHRYCRYLLPQDGLTEDESENLDYLYEGYTALGLNGTGKRLYEQIIEKPIKIKD